MWSIFLFELLLIGELSHEGNKKRVTHSLQLLRCAKGNRLWRNTMVSYSVNEGVVDHLNLNVTMSIVFAR